MVISKTHRSRLKKLRGKMKSDGIKAMLVTKVENVTYLTGFTGDDSYLFVTARDQVVLSDFRYITQLEEESVGFDVEIRGQGQTLLDLVSKCCGKATELAIEADSLSVTVHEQLSAKLTRASLRSSAGMVESLREIKDRGEVEEIRNAVQLAQRAFKIIRALLRGSQSEKSIAAELEYQIRQFGGDGCSFKPIVAVGPRAALPHAVPTDGRIDGSDFVLIDWGAKSAGYASDLTRVLVTGKISPKLERVYGVVLEAQLAAIAAIRPGAVMSDVDAAARSLIHKAGFGKRFGHGLGHGIGLEIHEAPRLAVNQDRPLEAGMVVTVEPGIYLPGWGGVRIEDDILVTRDGHEVLSDLPKQMEDCVVE